MPFVARSGAFFAEDDAAEHLQLAAAEGSITLPPRSIVRLRRLRSVCLALRRQMPHKRL
jgi:hypothetical protein